MGAKRASARMMSALRLATARRAGGAMRAPQCPQQQLAAELLLSRANGPQKRNALALFSSSFCQKRFESSSSNTSSDGQRGQRRPPRLPPQLTREQLIGALRQAISLRPLRHAFHGQSLRKLYRQSPEELVLAILMYAPPPLNRTLADPLTFMLTRWLLF